MNTPSITQTDALWNQQLKLNPNLKAGSDVESRLFVENTANQAKYLLQGWQMALLATFESGQATIADSVREIAPKFPGEVNENSTRQFCQWILDEGLAIFVTQSTETAQPAMAVAPQQEVPEQADPQVNPIAQAAMTPAADEVTEVPTLKNSRPSKGSGAFASLVKIAACVAVGLGTWKFTTTVLPIVNGASTNNFAVAGNTAVELNNASASSITPIEADTDEDLEATEESSDAIEADAFDPEQKLKELRDELGEVQTERDESYDKSDEDAYRNAVQKIAKITHEIGEIQAKMNTELAHENPRVAYGAGNSTSL